MLDKLIQHLQQDTANWERFKDYFEETNVPAKTLLLSEGSVSTHFLFIKKGCLRMWFNKDGKDVTFQFFFEGQGVASIDSLICKQPSLFNIESIEASTLLIISREQMEELQKAYPELKEGFQEILFKRFRNYAQLFLSRIKDSPRERYEELLRHHPEMIRRIPQHYIASYLGITPISLSRIKNRR